MPERIKRTEQGTPSQESKEGVELFRATLGFDFVFTRDEQGNLRCFCIEINGHDTGVNGVEDIPKGQISEEVRKHAAERAKEDPEMERRYKLAAEINRDMKEGHFKPTPEGQERIYGFLRKSMRKAPTFKNAYHNPDFIEDITRDKWLQERYIPPLYRPRTWHEEDSTISSSGYWVVKHRRSRGGDHVFVLDNEAFEEHLSDIHFIADYVAQEFILSAGAQMVPESVGKRAASLRLLMDFRYLQSGTIATDYEVSYQRVSPFTVGDTRNKEGKVLGREDIFVVNRHRGATSAPASPEELHLARQAAEEIIQNIAMAYTKDIERKQRTDASLNNA